MNKLINDIKLQRLYKSYKHIFLKLEKDIRDGEIIFLYHKRNFVGIFYLEVFKYKNGMVDFGTSHDLKTVFGCDDLSLITKLIMYHVNNYA